MVNSFMKSRLYFGQHFPMICWPKHNFSRIWFLKICVPYNMKKSPKKFGCDFSTIGKRMGNKCWPTWNTIPRSIFLLTQVCYLSVDNVLRIHLTQKKNSVILLNLYEVQIPGKWNLVNTRCPGVKFMLNICWHADIIDNLWIFQLLFDFHNFKMEPVQCDQNTRKLTLKYRRNLRFVDFQSRGVLRDEFLWHQKFHKQKIWVLGFKTHHQATFYDT